MIQAAYWMRSKRKRKSETNDKHNIERKSETNDKHNTEKHCSIVKIISVRQYNDQLTERLTDTHRNKQRHIEINKDK